MIGLRGRFGLVLTTGDILRITSIGALHQSPTGIVLLDVLLDHGGVPDGIDLAWQPKRYLGAPVPGATVATVNLAHVVAAVEFLAEETVEQPSSAAVLRGEDVEVGPAQGGSLSETIERANEVADNTSQRSSKQD
jgi:primosomal replication protein N